jgi:hypothetical protein
MRIVGLNYYAANEAHRAGLLHEFVAVSIFHEPTNTHDSDAHAVYCGPHKLGHVPRFAAKLFRAARVPSPIKGSIVLVRGPINALEIRLRIENGIEAAPKRHAINAIRSSASGVYAIANVFDMRAYIGKAHNMEDRRREHLAALQQGKHFSPRLLADWREYPQRFAFVVLKPAALDRLDFEESKFIDLYGTNDSALGYNQGQGFAPGSQSDPSRTSTAPRSATTPPSAAGDGARSDPPRGAPFTNPYADLAEQASRPSAAARPGTATNRPAPPFSRQRGTPRGGGCLMMLLVVPVFLCAALLCLR